MIQQYLGISPDKLIKAGWETLYMVGFSPVSYTHLDPTRFRKFHFTILQSNISIYAVCRITSYRILF